MNRIGHMPGAVDPLAEFRRPGSIPAALPDVEDTGYRAFSVASGSARPLRIDIRPARSLAFSRFYAGLSEIQYDHLDYSGVILVFATKRVRLKGRNLRPVIEALNAGTCEYVAELDDGDTAPDDDAPVIEQISIGAPDGQGREPGFAEGEG